MYIVRVIESKVWVHKISGRTASIYGALPYLSIAERDNWEIRTRGWTWEMSNGTIGFGRMAAKTQQEAEDVMQSFNNRLGV